ncbi:unnamed protein product [Heterobilharzia americana]|nr:unnamed protein product [Heterobilharzia americana]
METAKMALGRLATCQSYLILIGVMGVISGSKSTHTRSTKHYFKLSCFKSLYSLRGPRSTFPWHQRSHSVNRPKLKETTSLPAINYGSCVHLDNITEGVDKYESEGSKMIDLVEVDRVIDSSENGGPNELYEDKWSEKNNRTDCPKPYSTADLVAIFESLGSQYKQSSVNNSGIFKRSQYTNHLSVRLNDDNTTNDNNDHVDNENKSRLISESLDTENNDISSAEEATLRLKDCFKNYEERQNISL